MSIITKPAGGILKGVPATITLSKVELAAHPLVSADEYFSDSDNWNKILLKYKSSEGRQYEVVEFNGQLASPTGFFSVSEKARDLFEIQTLEIIDFDGGIFIVPRGSLTTEDFDVDFSVAAPVVGGPVIWDLLNGPTTNEVGGLFTNPNAADWNKLAKSSNGFGGDFTLSFVFDSSDDNEIALGVSKNKTDLSDFSDAYAMLNRYNQGFFEFLVGTSNISGNYLIPASGVQNLIVQRVGDQLTFTLNETLLVTRTVTGTLYPLGRAFLGNIISTYYELPEAPAV